MTQIPRLVVFAALAAALGACQGGTASLGGDHLIRSTARYSLQVEPGLDRVALAVHEAGLSANQGSALEGLVRRFYHSGAQTLVIEAPSGGDPVAASMAWTIRAALEGAGIPAQRLQVVGYQAPNPRAPVLVGYETVAAVVPQCGQAWGNLGRTGDNRPSSNFGCAVNANLAAQIANPRDIQHPRSMTPIDAARRSVVFDNYVEGKVTSAEPEPLVSGSRISEAVE